MTQQSLSTCASLLEWVCPIVHLPMQINQQHVVYHPNAIHTQLCFPPLDCLQAAVQDLRCQTHQFLSSTPPTHPQMLAEALSRSLSLILPHKATDCC